MISFYSAELFALVAPIYKNNTGVGAFTSARVRAPNCATRFSLFFVSDRSFFPRENPFYKALIKATARF